MAQLLYLDTFSSDSGNLTVIEKVLPGSIKRVFYIDEAEENRWVGRRYPKAWHAILCLNGQCRIGIQGSGTDNFFWLDDPKKCLLLEPEVWHRIDELTSGAFLLVISNEYDDPVEFDGATA
ncbi:FdtA/QdtA family cupin domain-containing protein [Larkinella knui]|uniref:WxcM-like domain-containing protein n=1 Tax=Larkinella knui TaxID=2025310 RepID=A0A3P1CPL9_9BACT|nr:FdtA/QdtA family cupin domain-containing protein [Larkinella knui]RRB14996.1 WxcM-like domain-containing protein [Larkinella knui]